MAVVVTAIHWHQTGADTTPLDAVLAATADVHAAYEKRDTLDVAEKKRIIEEAAILEAALKGSSSRGSRLRDLTASLPPPATPSIQAAVAAYPAVPGERETVLNLSLVAKPLFLQFVAAYE